MTSPWPTHEVTNQVPPLAQDPVGTDPALRLALADEAGWGGDRVRAFGQRVASPEVIEWGFLANRHPPTLRAFDPTGHRVDEVEFHPAWHELLRLAVAEGMHNLPWADGRPGSHRVRAALCYLAWQNENGHGCPVSMTLASVPVLQRQPEIFAAWRPSLASTAYDRRFLPAPGKDGALVGMAMTEKQGGSDVRANTTRAAPLGRPGPGEPYRLTGHKWFCSAPMCDAFLVLAQAEGGLSCFLLPRWTPEGRRNGLHIQRLKDKLGNRANASSEIEFLEAFAWLIGEEGRGVATIIEMVNQTRLDCILSTAAMMRQATVHALHHAEHRRAFGKRLIDQPLMQNVLADLCLESLAASLLAFRVAGAFDRRAHDPQEAAFRRIACSLGKYWVCKRGPVHAAEAMECLGGNGFVEESILPRLYREQPLNSIWEGCGNINCLDVLRALAKEPACAAAVLAEIAAGASGETRLQAHLRRTERLLHEGDPERGARRAAEAMALGLQASLLVRHAPAAVADAFCASRLDGEGGLAFGTLPASADCAAILAHAKG